MSKSGYQQRLGRWGENLAAEYLIGQGMEILERNYHTPSGELDLVARYKEIIVFIEVKTRTSNCYGFPEDAVTDKKQKNLLDSAQYYLMEHPEMDGDWRVDILAIELIKKEDDPTITWFENAI